MWTTQSSPHMKLIETLRDFCLVSLAVVAPGVVLELSTVHVVDVSSAHVAQDTRVMCENYLTTNVHVTHFIKIDEVDFSIFEQ